jgi:DNA-binding CsgD family transcriptional regulator
MLDKLIITILIYGLSYYVIYAFGFNIIKVKVSFQQLISPICIMTLYGLFGKLFLHSLNLYTIILIPLNIILLAVTEKKATKDVNIFSIANFLKLSWAAIIMILSNAVGFVLVIAPLSLHKEVAIFFITTIYGYNTACAIEALFVALLWGVLIKFPQISLIPPIKEKIDWIDVVAFITSTAMFALTFSASVTLVTSLMKHSKHALGNLFYQWLIIVIAVSGHFISIRNMNRKNVKLEEDKKQLEAEKNRLESEKTRLEEVKNTLEQEQEKLVNRVKELIDANLEGNSIVAQELLCYFNECSFKINNAIKALPNLGYISIDDEKNPINLATGLNNIEIAKILGLNPREMDIAHLLMCGKSNKEIGESLGMKANTAGNQVSDLLEKFKLNDRNRFLPYLFQYFISIGLITDKSK